MFAAPRRASRVPDHALMPRRGLKGLGAVAVLMAAMLLFPIVAAGAGSIRFDGETYEKQFTSSKSDIRLAEYVRRNETVKNWTKLVAVRNFPKLTDPKVAAA